MSLATLVGLYGSDSDSDGSDSEYNGANYNNSSDLLVAGGSRQMSGTGSGGAGASCNEMKVGGAECSCKHRDRCTMSSIWKQ